MDSIFEHNKKKVATAVFVFVVIISIFFVVKVINEIKEGRYIGTGTSAQSTISVAGEGEVLATPDIAEFSFTVTEMKSTVKDAQEIVTEKMNGVLKVLKDDFKIEEKDIKTSSYNIYPKYEWRRIECFAYPCPSGKNILTGYEVSHSVYIKIRDLDEAGNILTDLGERGVSNVGSINFSIDEEEELKEEARMLAIEDAKEKAEQLADELGVGLVRVVSFYENNIGTSPRFAMMESDMAFGKGGGIEAPEIPTGESNIVSRVNIVYEIR